jgi:L-rhamnose isomerase/sugar isomerase
MTQTGYAELADELAQKGIDVDAVKSALKQQRIETPSWAYGDSGTRFKVFPCPGAARNVHEKLSDASFIHSLTGIAPSVALHIPWDQVDDWHALNEYAAEQGIEIGSINPNVFQDEIYKFGSFCNSEASVRRAAIDRAVECIDIMKTTGSSILSLWFADGTNYPGQDSFRARKRRMEEALEEVYAALPDDSRMLIEYKFFEPAFYQTDIPDWGTAATFARKLGPKAQVLVDTGHHPQGTNIEHIVAFLLDEALLGGFHFNDRKYADDDLIVGSLRPFELFLIYNELVAGAVSEHAGVAACAKRVAYMLDQSHNIEPKLEAVLLSVVNCQKAYARALCVDREAVAARRADQDVLGAHRVLLDAYETVVRPLLAQVRIEMGLAPDPFAACAASDYPDRVRDERGASQGSVSGYPGA